MFERFTDRARRTVVLAQEEARLLGCWYIGTEHFLLGLMSEGEGLAAQALTNLGFSLPELRVSVKERITEEAKGEPRGHIPFTPRVKEAMEQGLHAAVALGVNYIGTEHLLLGILDEGEGQACQILVTKADLDSIRGELTALIERQPPPPQNLKPAPVPTPDALASCRRVLDGMESDRHRVALLAYLSAWYSRGE